MLHLNYRFVPHHSQSCSPSQNKSRNGSCLRPIAQIGLYYQVQEYTLHLLKRKKAAFDYSSLKFSWQVLQVIKSVVIIDLDESDKIIRLVDQWNGADLPTCFKQGHHQIQARNSLCRQGRASFIWAFDWVTHLFGREQRKQDVVRWPVCLARMAFTKQLTNV